MDSGREGWPVGGGLGVGVGGGGGGVGWGEIRKPLQGWD